MINPYNLSKDEYKMATLIYSACDQVALLSLLTLSQISFSVIPVVAKACGFNALYFKRVFGDEGTTMRAAKTLIYFASCDFRFGFIEETPVDDREAFITICGLDKPWMDPDVSNDMWIPQNHAIKAYDAGRIMAINYFPKN